MQSPHKLDLLQLMGAFLLQFDVQQVLKSIPFIRAWGSRGSNGFYNCHELVAPVTRTSMYLLPVTPKESFYTDNA